MAAGRKRAFDENQALNAAMDVFWQKGYVGASLTDLTQSMGINKPSMYSAFGNKEALFIKATEHYVQSKMKDNLVLLSEQNTPLKTRLKNYMLSIVAMQCGSELPKGCYLVLCQSELVGGDIPQDAARLLSELEATPKQLLTELFRHDPEAVKLGLATTPETHAISIYTVLKGTASMARSGVPMHELTPVVDNILTGIGVH